MLMNYVELTPEIPLRLHFTDDYRVQRDLPDPLTGKTKRVDSLIFWVDEVNGQPVAKTFSIVSKGLAALLEPYLSDKAYREYDFTITKRGSGFATQFQVDALPRG